MTESYSTTAPSPGFAANDDRATVIRRRRHLVIGIGVILGLLLLGYIAFTIFKPKPKPAAPPGIPVATTPAKTGDLDVYLDAIGTVTPVYTDTIVSQVAGMITEVHFKEGQIVKKNDLLAVVDPRPYLAALQQAQGQLARDEATLKNAHIDLTRYENSYKVHAIPEQQLATQQATVDADEATVKLDRGNLAAAQVNVDYTRIVSPIAGRVGLRNIDPGNVVAANSTSALCVVTQIQPITVIFTIAEDEIGEVTAQMATGKPLKTIALDRSKTHQLDTGTLLTVDNQVNTSTGTVRARATFPNADNKLFPNQFVNTRLLVKTLTQATLVPQAAIQRNNDQAFVYVLQPDSTVKLTKITILATEGENSAVDGVKSGDQLVTDGFDKLQDGSKVRVRKPGETNSGKGNASGKDKKPSDDSQAKSGG
jgi:multidrug efflux system membrane fusion protein